jgi:farnesyl diphosphate synthase
MTLSQTLFDRRAARAAAATERMLEGLLVDMPVNGEVTRPPLLMEALRYAVLGGGKRFRPFLVIETARLFGVSGTGPVRAGAALEMVHCYSLIHDDLPAMDDDDMRRGKPTLHKVHDDAMAVLAGDALLTLAFDVLADRATVRDPARQVALVRALARGAGIGGMVGGQLLDLAAEGRYPRGSAKPPGQEAVAGEDHIAAETGVIRIQSMKTGALIRTAAAMGAILGGARQGETLALDSYAQALGLAFQIKDDLLDAVGDAATLGKAAGKDAVAGKATFVSLHGVAGAQRRLAEVTADGETALARFGSRGSILSGLLAFNLRRHS